MEPVTDIVELHARALAEFDARMQKVRPDDWDRPTPCTRWDVRALVNHMVCEDRWTVPLLAGATLEQVGDRFDGDLLGQDPLGAWLEASVEAARAVRAEGVLERMVHVSWGMIPAQEYVWQLLSDHLIHAWDLARGIGDDDELDRELVEVCFERSHPIEDDLKASGLFGEKIEPPEGADLQTRLLAVYGRRR